MDANLRKKLSSLLEVIRIKCKDLSFDSKEVFDLFLQARAPEEGNYSVHINSLTRILQLDLFVNITEDDQHLLVMKYGDNFGNVDVKSLLDDLGMWPQDRRSGAHGSMQKRKDSENHADVTQTPLRVVPRVAANADELSFIHQPPSLTIVQPPRIESSRERDQESLNEEKELDFGDFGTYPRVDRLQTTKAFDVFADLVQRTNNSIDSLADIHSVVANTRQPRSRSTEPSGQSNDDVAGATQRFTIRVPDQVDGQTSKANGTNPFAWDRITPSNSSSDIRGNIDLSERDLLGPPVKDRELARIAALTHENEMLKKEMKVFDSEFFEELEDLKYRFAVYIRSP